MERSQRDQFHDVFVLHSRPFRNSSQIVELLTAEQGRVGVVARGVRRGKKSSSALLQPFRPLQVSWSGRGELYTLTRVEEVGSAGYPLIGRRLLCGLYANELLVRLLHREESHPDLFLAYQRLLLQLEQGEHEGRVLRGFEIHLLEAIGFGFDLHQDGQGLPIYPQQRYGYHPEEGLMPINSSNGRQVSVMGQTLEWLRSTEHEVEQWILREAR
ncbi:MAG: DNA repair protein RecO, partial [Gammaproteobacteria bacterium]|nr:DNA repair protein RecO [Gammaproteobacteria bacterium]